MRSSLILAFILFFTGSLYSQPLWLRYPAISPDGKYIAFEYKGNIWKVPVEGGRAIPLTLHPGYEFHPVWSPDGQYIAFASDRYGDFDIFVIKSDGTGTRRLTYYSGNEIPWTFTNDSKSVLYSTYFQKLPTSLQFPAPYMTELYQINVDGTGFKQVLSTPAQWVSFTPDGKKFVYQDIKGVENYWRKHQRSSVARDIWIYDLKTKKHTKLTQFEGEDRCPAVGPDGKTVYFLTEQFNNTLNVAKFSLDNPEKIEQLTNFTKHPVRFLTIANDGTLCFSWDGEIYTMKDGQKPHKVNIKINYDGLDPQPQYKIFTDDATEMAVSPDGNYIAFVVRGDVYVTSVDNSQTRQITSTPEEERNIGFSPDGKSIVYASERNGSWNIYMTSIQDTDQKSFLLAKKLKETTVIATANDEFQPKFSPDGKKIAYLENRTQLNVIDLQTKKVKKILDGRYNYSYRDGDQWFDWSPDGKWFLVRYTPHIIFISDVGLVKADGSGQIINLTQSGYDDRKPIWSMNGQVMVWLSDKQGYRSHGSWGSEYDVYAMFFTRSAYDVFKMNNEEYKAWKEKQKKLKKDSARFKNLKLDLQNISDRIVRLTNFSGPISQAVLTDDGQKLFYAAKFEEGYGLWQVDIRKKSTKLVTKLPGYVGQMTLSKDGKFLFVFSDGKIFRLSTADGQKKQISFKAEKLIDYYAEKRYIFDHVWRLIKEKFYDPDLHGVDWDYYGQHYRRFLPYINNNYDFAEMLSEMLGELNASHTGAGYRPKFESADKTASLGLLYDLNYSGKGVKVAEIIEQSPFYFAKTNLKPGDIITQINGQQISSLQDLFKALNHKTGQIITVTYKHGLSTYTQTIKPISLRQQNKLLYQRWVKKMRNLTHELSHGKIGYVHVKAMNSESFRQVYSDALGKEIDKQAIIVDTRYNTGGWLHDDLITLLSGKKYLEFWPRDRYFGYDPFNKWIKPSVVLVNESNYSDGCGFPYAYKYLKIGKLVGMPVPGTMTAVWWETLLDPTLYFGIPQVGVKNNKGQYLENHQLEPDVKIWNDYSKIIKGQDQQLQGAIKLLMNQIRQTSEQK